VARSKLPDPLEKRHLLEGDLDPARARALGETCLEAGREIDAVAFLAVAGVHDALRSLQEQALARGDVFLMRAASSALGEEPVSETWRSLAETASAAGRDADAETARRLATVGD
jgi:hypothetical protein